MCGPGPDKVGPTADQGAQAEINAKMWNYYQTNYKPVLDKYIASRTDPKVTVAEKNKVAGQVNADVMKSVKPQSATNAVANAKNLMDLADVKSSATESGKESVDTRKVGTEQNIINIGRGQTTKTMAGMDELAGMSVDKAIRDKARDEEVMASEENAIGSTAGTVAAIGTYGAMKRKPLSMDDIINKTGEDEEITLPKG